MEHTKGPWIVSEWTSESTGEIHIGVDTNYPTGKLCDGSRSIVSTTGCALTAKGRPEPERSETIMANRANARLIAAAPDLLEALVGVVKEFGQFGPKLNIRKDFSRINALNAATNAIARAVGAL